MLNLSITTVFLLVLVALSAQRGRFHVGSTVFAIITGVMLAHTVIGAFIAHLVSSAASLTN